MWDFKEQLEKGNAGEKIFITNYASLKPVKSEKERYFDFTLKDGKKVELKTDTYSMDATPNFFMERFGDIVTKKSGGPWRATEDKVEFFVYFFLKDKTFFWFEPKKLCKFLDKYIEGKSYRPIPNKGWVAGGYPVPRELCKPYLIRMDKF